MWLVVLNNDFQGIWFLFILKEKSASDGAALPSSKITEYAQKTSFFWSSTLFCWGPPWFCSCLRCWWLPWLVGAFCTDLSCVPVLLFPGSGAIAHGHSFLSHFQYGIFAENFTHGCSFGNYNWSRTQWHVQYWEFLGFPMLHLFCELHWLPVSSRCNSRYCFSPLKPYIA